MKLKTLGAIVGAAVMCATPACSPKQKKDVPRSFWDVLRIEIGEGTTEDGEKIVTELYLVDRNGDGKTDLIEDYVYKFKDGGIAYEKWLYIDNDFDGYIDKIFGDCLGSDGAEGGDGVYDKEVETHLNTELIIRYLRHTPDDGLLAPSG